MAQPSIAIVVNPERRDSLNGLLDALGATRSDVDVLEPGGAAAAIRDGRRRTIDTGVVDGATFMLNASTGYDAAVMRRVDDGPWRVARRSMMVCSTCAGRFPWRRSAMVTSPARSPRRITRSLPAR